MRIYGIFLIGRITKEIENWSICNDIWIIFLENFVSF